MKKIQILGTGCAKCRKLAENARAAADRAGVAYELVKVTDLTQIARMGVVFTPALAVDGRVLSSGKVLDVPAIEALIKE